jgi:hypothetical protein
MSKSRDLCYQPVRPCRSVPHAADDQFGTLSDIALKKATCESVEKPTKLI